MRFNNLNIPQGAFITNAYIQFTVDESLLMMTLQPYHKGQIAVIMRLPSLPPTPTSAAAPYRQLGKLDTASLAGGR